MSLASPAPAGNIFRQPSLFPPPGQFHGDPTAGKHHGADTSIQAHERVLPHKRAIYERILAAVQGRGTLGASVHELAEALGTLPHRISGRLTELRAIGRLVYKLDEAGARVKRRGACVLVAVDQDFF
jgi:hypothetical protein